MAKTKEEIKEANRIACRKYRAKNLEARRKYDREHAMSIREHRLMTHKEWAKKNRGYLRSYFKEWLVKNRTERSNVPKWANRFFIKEIYALAKLRTKITGFPWEVDHIIPINGKFVSGLHVENNLRVVPRVVNKSKGNKYFPSIEEFA